MSNIGGRDYSEDIWSRTVSWLKQEREKLRRLEYDIEESKRKIKEYQKQLGVVKE